MRSSAALAVVPTVLVLAMASAGCETSYSGPSKSDYVSKANAICSSTGAGVKQAIDEFTAQGLPTTAQQRALVGDVILPQYQKRVDRLRGLEAPTSDRKKIDEFIRAYQSGLDELKRNPTVLTSGDPFLEAYIKAQVYGMKACEQ
jgi:hypothetical protein